MEMNTIIGAVSSVGFPIVCAGVCMWFCYKLIEKGDQDRREERERHEKEMNNIREAVENLKMAIENNSKVLESLIERMDNK